MIGVDDRSEWMIGVDAIVHQGVFITHGQQVGSVFNVGDNFVCFTNLLSLELRSSVTRIHILHQVQDMLSGVVFQSSETNLELEHLPCRSASLIVGIESTQTRYFGLG